MRNILIFQRKKKWNIVNRPLEKILMKQFGNLSTSLTATSLLSFCINLKLRMIFHWPKIVSDTDSGYLFYQNYSKNSCTAEYEPQDAHFSSKQTSLHCTLIYGCEEKPKCAYHISDNKGHGSTFTLLATKIWWSSLTMLKDFPLPLSKVTTVVFSVVVSMSLKPF